MTEVNTGETAVSLAGQAAGRAEDPAAPGKFTLGSKLAFIIGLVGGVAGLVIMLAVSKESGLKPLAGLGAAVFGIVLIAGLFKLLIEAMQVSPRDRTTPEKAVKAYMGAVKQQRWEAAFACLSWVAKDGKQVVRPAMSDIDLEQAQFAISSPKDLKAYWSDFVGGMKTRGARKLSCKAKTSTQLSDNVSTVSARWGISIDLKTASLTGPAVKKLGGKGFFSVKFVTEWPVYRRDNLWYLLEVGFPPEMKMD